MKQNKNRMQELITLLNNASKAYYAEDREVMSNLEYDKYYDELVQLEEESGMVLSNSPTHNVGYEALEELPKEKHEKPMLSLGKTKSLEELVSWIKEKEGILSWKLDGLTIVLTYEHGELIKAVTRGNGEVGEVITNNAKVFSNVPLKIKEPGSLIVRGEAVITYSDFEKINEEIPEVENKYKNPRNLCSGSVRQLNNEITAKRHVQFYAFSLVKHSSDTEQTSREAQFQFLKELGFAVVEYEKVNKDTMEEAVLRFQKKIEHFDIPSDGLVLSFDDIQYGENLGRTAKFPRDSIAFKWEDEIAETTLVEVEWSPSRTGLINPVAIFEPVELEGTTVSRASLHNISIVQALKIGIGDRIRVYKANMIIPQVAENISQSNTLVIPDTCPVCGGRTELRKSKEVQSLYCSNENCQIKKIKSFSHLVSRDALNMEGLSEATLEKFIQKGFIHSYRDLFHLDQHLEAIVTMDGFGEKSYQNLIASIEKARTTTLAKMLYGLGIANIGLAGAKMIAKEFDYSLENIKAATQEELSQISGIGEVIAASVHDFFQDSENLQMISDLMSELNFQEEIIDESAQTLKGLTFVITGSLNHYENRNALKEQIEQKGGKVTGSVTSKTTCLINNDNTSNSSKNKTAKDLQIPILTEEEFMAAYMN